MFITGSKKKKMSYDYIRKLKSELSARERIVLKLRYGLYNEEEYTQREIRQNDWDFKIICFKD